MQVHYSEGCVALLSRDEVRTGEMMVRRDFFNYQGAMPC